MIHTYGSIFSSHLSHFSHQCEKISYRVALKLIADMSERGVFRKSKKFNSCGSHLTSMRDLILFIAFYKLHLKIVGGLRGNTYKPGAPLLVAISGGE